MKRASLFFTAPGRVEIREDELPPPGPGQVLVKTLLSAVSPGSEMLVYRGLAPDDLAADETISSLAGSLAFPLRYGYSCIGIAASAGPEVSQEWVGRTVFSFQPHADFFLAGINELHPVPPGIEPHNAVLLPAMETAVNLVMDGRIVIGEQVIVFGQGIIGLLTAALILLHPVAGLLTLDRYSLRRQFSLGLGARAFHPDDREAIAGFLSGVQGADLIFELSGNPAALDQAVMLAGSYSRIVIGSWYGKMQASLNLGGRFHRDRIRLIGSQVSTIDPERLGRWDKDRRFGVAWDMIGKIGPAQWITHRFPFDRAAAAYDLLDRHPEECLQIIFTYP